MARLNTALAPQPARASHSPLRTTSGLTTTTHECGQAATFDDKTALFFMGAGSFFNEDSFYQKADDRSARYVDLVRRVAVTDPAWFVAFVGWLRQKGHIRTGAIVAAAEGAEALTKAGKPDLVRRLVHSVLVRADEPGEFVAYWQTHIRRAFPRNVRRGLQDAIRGLLVQDKIIGQLYNQRSAIKWDSSAKAWRMADVVELVHPRPQDMQQRDLLKYLLDQRHHGDGSVDGLFLLDRYRQLQQRLATERDQVIAEAIADPEMLGRAGMTWEALSSSGPMDATAWTAIIPNMGYMALVRNLRNFEQAGVDPLVLKMVAEKLADPDEVALSRQLPYRFLSAYLQVQGAVWQHALETALSHSVRNIPELPGRTVVLVDTSSSMSTTGYSARSKITPVMAGALFAVALAAKNSGAVLYGFADGPSGPDPRLANTGWTAYNTQHGYSGSYTGQPFLHPVVTGAAVLKTTEAFARRIGENGHGTNIASSLKWAHERNRDAARFVVVTDGQCQVGNVGSLIPSSIPIYAVNMVGYASTAIESSSARHQLGGLTDATFGLIKAVETAQQGRWPWDADS